MTETQNVATYARVRPYNPAINEDKKLTARCKDGTQILNQNGGNEDSYNFTRVFDMIDSTDDVFNNGVKPLLDYKILQGINSIFIVYGQSGSGKSFTLIGERGHLGVLPMSLQYLLDKSDIVENIQLASIEAYGIKAAKIGFYDLVAQLKNSEAATYKKGDRQFDPYTSSDNPRLNSSNADLIEITRDNCLEIITKLQNVSHMAPTLKNPHSSRGHTVYFARVKMVDLEPVYFIAVDLAGSEGQTALGTKNEFVEGLKLAISKGKLELDRKQLLSFEEMYKIRSLEAGCINNGLTQLQSIFGELIKKKISKSQGLGLRKVLSSFISLNSAYAILFTLSASANNNKVTRATLNFAKQTQLVKVETKKAKKKIDKDKIIKQLNELIDELRNELSEKDEVIDKIKTENEDIRKHQEEEAAQQLKLKDVVSDHTKDFAMVFGKIDELNRQLDEAAEEEAMWHVDMNQVNENNTVSEEEMRKLFDEFDKDNSGTIDNDELHEALMQMGHKTISQEQIDTLITEIDVNDDGQVDFEEFKVLFNQSWFIDMHENRLIRSTHRAVKTMTLMLDDLDLKDMDEFDFDDDDDNENLEHIGSLDDKDTKIDALETEIIQLKLKYENEIASLKEELSKPEEQRLNELTKENEKLKVQMKKLEVSGHGDGDTPTTLSTQFKQGVREIVHIQIGQCGNQIGNVFWDTMTDEHHLDERGMLQTFGSAREAKLHKVDVYFKEASYGRYVPRSVMVDLEPSSLDAIRASEIGAMFSPDNFISGSSGASNNWAKGHYTDGAELIDEVLDTVRKEIESCDCPQGVQMTHALGGGTGSGLGTLLLMKIRDAYPDRINATFSVFPSTKVSDVVVEPYNAVLSIHQLLENSDETFIMDNESLYNISENILKQPQPKYADLNWVISLVMSGITASLRFSGKLNSDLRKMGVNLIPFPRLHFFAVAQAPLFAASEIGKVNVTVQEVTEQMWSGNNFLVNVKPNNGKYLSASCGYRGNIQTQTVDDELAKVQAKMAEDFVTWIPNNIKSSIVRVPPNETRLSGTFVANNTALKAVFQRTSTQFAKLYKRKAFLHWYKGEGMDESEFQESDKNIRDLITEYQDKEDVVVGDDGAVADGGDDDDDEEEDDE